MPAKWTIASSQEEVAFLVEAGIICRDGGNLQAAHDIFAGVKALFPHSDCAEVFLGTVEFQQGNFSKAEAHYRKALELNPRSAFALAHLGEVRLFSKDKEGARAHLKHAVALDPLGEVGKMARRLMALTDQVRFV